MTFAGLAPFAVHYERAEAVCLLQREHVLAVFEFAKGAATTADSRHVQVPLPVLEGPAPCEFWTVAAPVACGRDGGLRWSAGGGWHFTITEVTETPTGGIEAASEHAYRLLLDHVERCREHELLRVWNYLGAINDGEGDRERYRLFCNGRARAMAAHVLPHYPAATAIGHHGPRTLLQVYALSASVAGQTLENPRQVSSWNYPRQYGPTAPAFARALQLPHAGGLAISGTAAVVGHASHHAGDVAAQAQEAVTNLRALLHEAALPAFDADSPLKVYVRDPADAHTVQRALAGALDPAVPRVLLNGDICRRELLVEIEGWRFAVPT